MALKAADTLRRRDDTARLWRRGQSVFARVVSGAGLWLADTVDVVRGVLFGPRTIFISKTLFGAWRGAGWGVVSCALLIANTATLVMPPLLLLGILGTSTVFFAVRMGQQALDNKVANPGTKIPGRIARATDAVPEKQESLLPTIVTPAHPPESRVHRERELARRKVQAAQLQH